MQSILVLLAGLLSLGAIQDSSAATSDAPPQTEDLKIERGGGLPSLRIPRNEKLEYRVHVDLGLIEAAVGKVTMTSEVEPYRRSLVVAPGADEGDKALETGHLTIHASGDYALYSMDATIETRILPQEWPRFSYLHIAKGSEEKRREVLLGRKDGKEQSSYRRDTNTGAPKGTRIWKKPKFREVPSGSIDMLTALYLSRSLVKDDLRVLRFPLLDKDTIWQLRLTKGTRKRMETASGTFDVVEILLEPSTYPGEEEDEEKNEKFEGLFGIHGSIHLWADRRTGIPVRIQGDLPIGPLTLGVDVDLTGYSGTDPDFQPVVEEE